MFAPDKTLIAKEINHNLTAARVFARDIYICFNQPATLENKMH